MRSFVLRFHPIADHGLEALVSVAHLVRFKFEIARPEHALLMASHVALVSRRRNLNADLAALRSARVALEDARMTDLLRDLESTTHALDALVDDVLAMRADRIAALASFAA